MTVWPLEANGMDEIEIASEKKGTMFRILTGNQEHAVVVATPERREAAMTTAGQSILRESSVYQIVGAGIHGKVEKPGCIARGYRMYFREITDTDDDGLTETAAVSYISPIGTWGNMSAMQIIANADGNVADMFDNIIQKFPNNEQPRVRGVVYSFGNYGGRMAALNTLNAARKNGKLKRALKIFALAWKMQFKSQSPVFIGDPKHKENKEIWEQFHKLIGIAPPAH